MLRAVRFLFCLCVTLLCLGCHRTQALPSAYLFFTSDIEGVFWSRPEPRFGNEMTGGLAVLKAFLDKQTLPYVLLDGGNWYAQTPEGTLSKGEYFNTTAASLPYAGRLFTDKDLLYSWGSLGSIIKKSPFPFVLSNVTAGGKTPPGAKPWLIVPAGEYRIGILGVVGRQAAQGKRRTGGLVVQDEIEAARKTVGILQQKGVNAIVLMSALGAADDKGGLTDARLAEEVPGIDVILSSNLGREAAETQKVGRTLIVYPGAKLDSVGQVGLFFDKNGQLSNVQFEDKVLYRRDFGEDASVAEQIAAVRRNARGPMNRPVGKLPQPLNGDLDGESTLGNWVADCIRKWAKADAAIMNADSLRADLPAGEVTQYDLYEVYPYADHIMFLDIKGAALKNALEQGLSVPHNFAQISGLRADYNPQAIAGKRIRFVTLNGAALSPTKVYRVAITDHMLAGGAGHDAFIDSLEFKNTQVEVRTILRSCLAGSKEPAAPALGRWRKVE